jgi:hypothetical protein
MITNSLPLISDKTIKSVANLKNELAKPYIVRNSTGREALKYNSAYLGVTHQKKMGRAMRYNLFARASQKGFPLLSLTQKLVA